MIRGECPSAATRSASRRALSSSPKLPSWTAQSPEGAGAVRLASEEVVDAVAGRSPPEEDDVGDAGIGPVVGDSAFATVSSGSGAALLRAGAALAAAASTPESDAGDEDGALPDSAARAVTEAVAGSARRSTPAPGRGSDDAPG